MCVLPCTLGIFQLLRVLQASPLPRSYAYGAYVYWCRIVACVITTRRLSNVFPAVIPAFVASAKFGDITFPLQYVIISTKARTAICE